MNKKLKKLLIDHNMTVTSLAKEMGINRSWLSLIINGHFKAYHIRIKIARFLKVPYEELWEHATDERQAA
jgi:DNA-binding Xre family transcriptional regulator